MSEFAAVPAFQSLIFALVTICLILFPLEAIGTFVTDFSAVATFAFKSLDKFRAATLGVLLVSV